MSDFNLPPTPPRCNGTKGKKVTFQDFPKQSKWDDRLAPLHSKMNTNELSDRLQKYETYVNDILKSDLNQVCDELDKVTKELAEYEELREKIKLMLKRKEDNEPYEFTTDIGSNFFARAVVDDISNIFLDIGFGYYLEFRLEEALQFVDAKEKFFNSKLTALRDKSAKIKAHIKLILLYCQRLYPAADFKNMEK